MDSATATWLRSAASLWLFFLHVTNAIRIDKSDGGYIDVRVSIHKAVPYNETIIENIKTLMRDSSGFLHRATHGSLHIKQVIIEIPSTWPRRPYATVRQGSGFEGSDVRVYASSDPNVESRPYTIQPRACGEPGDYIHLSSKFLEELNDHTTKEYGNPSYVFIHEWAHLRYGVFDEHGFLGSEKYPALYCDSEGKVRANVCSDKIAFTARTPSGEDCSVCKNNAVPQNCTVEFHQPAGDLVESSIMFMPYVDNVSEFCVGDNSEKNRHNAFAPNMQNDLCGSKSAWEVISGNDDFEWFPFAELGKFNDVEFQEVQQSNDVVPSMVYVLDVSTSMGGSRLNFVKEVAARRVNDLNDGSLNLGIVTFSTSASTKQEMSLVNDITKNHSLDAIDKLYASGYTCIGCGLLEALNVLKQANVSSKGATVMLMSDGNENQQPRIADVLGNMTSTGVVVNTLAVGADADHGLEKLAHDTGGIAFSFKDPDGTFFPEVDAIFAVSTTAQLDEAERPVMIMNAQVSFGGALKITFHLDEELGNGTVVYVVRERKGTATTNASLIDPAHTVCHKCHSYSSKGTGETKINIPSPAMPGNWTLVLSGPSGEVVRASIRVESRMRDSSVEPVRLKCTGQTTLQTMAYTAVPSLTSTALEDSKHARLALRPSAAAPPRSPDEEVLVADVSSSALPSTGLLRVTTSMPTMQQQCATDSSKIQDATPKDSPLRDVNMNLSAIVSMDTGDPMDVQSSGGSANAAK
ncbi:hypothetical protein HPB49_016951 [Dermacentor silvarum]|uniref:Uncharacterized protein n=1 Tax=Dermacentor silvarum TaxID=543639 RepID=A0ACB8DES8_DERSI|nr:hypothetical protein HPB49_016951 [Dermacentor silvarum]